VVERFGAAGMPSDELRKLLGRAGRMAAALGGSPGERVKLVRELVGKIIVDEKTIIIKLQRSLLLGGDVPSSASETASDSAVEPTTAVAFKHRGIRNQVGADRIGTAGPQLPMLSGLDQGDCAGGRVV
jgi:hypothetical protein